VDTNTNRYFFTARFAGGAEAAEDEIFLTCRETAASQKESIYGKKVLGTRLEEPGSFHLPISAGK
jgi:hypothetical protein